MKEKILLSLLIPYLAIGAVICNEVDGKMVCSGTGQLEADIGGNYLIVTNLVVTNVLGVCTNCVSMSPQQCREFSSFLAQQVNAIDYSLSECLDSADNIDYLYWQIYGTLGEHPDVTYELYTTLSPALSGIYDSNQKTVRNLNSIKSSNSMNSELIDLMDCEECQMYSPTVVTNNNYIVITNQGSITSGNWATYDQMVALQKSVSDIQVFVRNIKDQIEEQHTTISNFWKETHRDLQGISNLVHRLDDYVLGDYSNSVVHITQNMIMLTNELSNIQRRFFLDYKNITDESNIDDRLKSVLDSKGNWDFEELALHTNWFDRIELYLAFIAGATNQFQNEDITIPQESVDTTQIDSELDKADELKGEVEQIAEKEETRIQEISEKITSIFQVISSFVDVQPVKEIDIITNVGDREYSNLSLLNDVDVYVDTEQPYINNTLKIFRLATSAFWICSIAALSIFLLLQIYAGLKKLFLYILDFVNAVYGNL